MKKIGVLVSVALIIISIFSACVIYRWAEIEVQKEVPENNVPVADAGEDQIACVGDIVYFNGTGYDSDGIIVLEEWDYDGDGIYDWNSTLKMSSTHIYDVVRNYTATFRVTDDDGATDTDSCVITVINVSLSFSISMNKTTFLVGEPINVTAKLKNIGHESIYISELVIGYSPIPLYFEIVTPEGYLLRWGGPTIEMLPPTIMLAPQAVVETTYDIIALYYWYYDPLLPPYNFTTLGNYSVKGIYTSYAFNNQTWNGTLVSNILNFTIIPEAELKITIEKTEFLYNEWIPIKINITNNEVEDILCEGYCYTFILTFPNGSQKECFCPYNNSVGAIYPRESFEQTIYLCQFSYNNETWEKIGALPVGNYSIYAVLNSETNPWYNPSLSYKGYKSNTLNFTILSYITTIAKPVEKGINDTTNQSIENLQGDDGIYYMVNGSTCINQSTLFIDSFDVSGINGTVAGAILYVQYLTGLGYWGTNYIRWALDGEPLQNTTIQLHNSSSEVNESFDLFAHGVDTLAKMETLDVEFANPGGFVPGVSVMFDYIWIEIYFESARVLRFEISMNKTTFLVGEPINVTATLANLGNGNITVTDLNFYMGTLDFVIRTSEGEKLNRTEVILPGIPDAVVLEPSQYIEITVDVHIQYDFENVSDVYSIYGTYESGIAMEPVWVGTLYSNILNFTLLKVRPEVRTSENNYNENSLNDFFLTSIWESFKENYTTANYSDNLVNAVIGDMRNQAGDLELDDEKLEDCVYATGVYEHEYNLPRLPCLAEKTKFNNTDVWIIVFNRANGWGENNLGHIDIFVVDINTLETLYHTGCY